MNSLDQAVADFLSSPRIAVAGVSRDSRQAANAIYRKLKAAGHTVVATNPQATQVEGDPCHPTLRAIPGGVDAVVVATPPRAALEIVMECRDLEIRRVWLHRSFGQGSVSSEAVDFCRSNDIAVIPGACPMMYCPPVDLAHRCMHVCLGWFGRLPKIPG